MYLLLLHKVTFMKLVNIWSLCLWHLMVFWCIHWQCLSHFWHHHAWNKVARFWFQAIQVHGPKCFNFKSQALQQVFADTIRFLLSTFSVLSFSSRICVSFSLHQPFVSLKSKPNKLKKELQRYTSSSSSSSSVHSLFESNHSSSS